MNPWWMAIAFGLLIIFAMLRYVYYLGGEVLNERARESFFLQHTRLEHLLLAAGTARGLPRGLRWVECTFDDRVIFVWDKVAGAMAALVSATVRFEAIPGSDMEGLPAVAMPRQGTAVLHFYRGDWHADARLFFNMSPAGVIKEMAASLTPR